MLSGGYRLLLAAFFVSSVGDWIFRLAVPLFVFEATRSPVSMAVAYALTFLPFLVVMPFGGLIADRFDRRRVLIVGDLLSAVVISVLALVAVVGAHRLWFVYPLI